LLPVRIAGALWSVMGMTAAALTVRALLRAYLPGKAWAHAVVGTLVLMSAPAVVTLLTGQWPFVFVTMLGALVLLLRADRPVAAGLVAAGMLVKPQLFLFAAAALAVRALWPGRAGRTFVISAAAAGIATVAVSWILVPSWWPTWFQRSPAVLLGIEPVTIQTLFIQLFGPNGGWIAAPVLLAMVAAGLQFHPLGDGWLPVWFALSSAGVVYSNTYDVLLLIVPIVLAAGALRSRRRAAVVIIAGALWSVYRLARHREPARSGVRRGASSPGQLVVGNLLIAAGTLVLSASGTLAGRLGKDRAFAVTLLVGIVVLFAGFLVASTMRRRPLVTLRQRAA